MTRAVAWSFSPAFDNARRSRLEAVQSLEDVVSTMISQMEDITFHVGLGSDPGLVGCKRPVFTFKVTAETFDAFFNSAVGYRAQFLVEPNLGQAANGVVLHRLTPRLLKHVPPVSALCADLVALSLQGASAKLWIREKDFPFSNLSEDLAVPAWVAAAQSQELKAKWGLNAPTGPVLEVKGAFLSTDGHEIVPSNKICRRFEIAKWGFS